MKKVKRNATQPAPKMRRPGSAGYPCGDDTREALIESALGLFGQRGYDGASTREIAAEANTTTPALQYYFQNKEGLYLACISRIAEVFRETMKEPISDAERALESRTSQVALIDAFITIETKLMELMFSSELTPRAYFIFSQQEAGLGPNAGFQLFYKEVHSPLISVNCAIIGRLMGRPATDSEVVARYIALHGQGVAFVASPRSSLRSLKWQNFDKGHAATIIDIVAGSMRHCLLALAKPQ